MRGILLALLLLVVAATLVILLGRGAGPVDGPASLREPPPSSGIDEPDPDSTHAEGSPAPDVPPTVSHPGSGTVADEVVTPVASISGVILRAGSGEPVPGARVGSPEDRNRAIETASGTDGRFLLSGLSPGRKVLVVTAEGFVETLVKDVEVVAGRETSGVVVRLGVGGIIHGIVYDSDGRPSPGAKVLLVPEIEGVRILGDFGTEIVADESGAYRIERLTPGRYRVRQPSGGSTPVVLAERAPDEDEDDPARVVGDGEVVRIDLRSDLTGVIRGTMRSTRGTPLRRQVNLLDPDGRRPVDGKPPPFAVPDEKGRFVLSDLPPGEHLLESDGVRTPVLVRAGRTAKTEIVFETARIEGVVLDETGAPVAGARVRWSRHTGSSTGIRIEVEPAAETDAAGRFAFADVTAGRYGIRAWTKTAAAESETFEIRPSEARSGVLLRLERPVEVRIVVRDGAGAPVAGIPVEVAGQEGRTDAEGAAVLRVSPGTHPILAGTPPDAVMRVVRIRPSVSQTFTLTKE